MGNAVTSASPTPLASWGGWRQLLDIKPVHWRQLAWWRAARVATGVVVPFAIGDLTGHLEYGAFAALGALPAGFVSFQGSSRSRLSAIGLASAGMAVTTFLGALAARYEIWAMVPLIIVLAYGCGLAVSLGQRLSVACLQVAVAAEISISVPLAVGPAAERGGFVLAGGLFQGVLIMATWALRPGSDERAALAATFGALARYAQALSDGQGGPPPAHAMPASEVAVDPNPLLSEDLRLRLVDLLEEAERVRASLAALAHYVQPDGGEALSKLCRACALVLEGVATALSAPRRQRPGLACSVEREVNALVVPCEVPWRWAGEALLGQLRAVAQMVSQWDEGPLARSLAGLVPELGAARQVDILSTVRANASVHSEAGRHALRLAVVAGITEVLVLGTGLPEGRWAVMTILIVLKPDYSTTVRRSAQRAVGTALGAGLGILGVEVGHLGHVALMLAAGAGVGAAYLIFDASYLFFSVALTAFVVLLLDALGTPALSTAGDRLVETAIGAALALCAFAVWPTWEGTAANHKLAVLLEAHSAYLACLFGFFTASRPVPLPELRRLQLSARRRRSDAEGSAERLRREAAQSPLSAQVASAVVAAVRRLATGELVLHSLAENVRAPRLRPDQARALDALARTVTAELEELAGELRHAGRARPSAPLRPLYGNLAATLPPESPLLSACDIVVDAVGTMASVLS